ncbi:alanine--tRNA ligase [bacterium]|nr:alanine--tRNA ligase [bacterium]
MKSVDLRNKYLEFFKKYEHTIIKSAPLVPINDPSLLLINAGMAPLKPYFLDTKSAPSPRMASVQKCLRTKDIDDVGTTPRHLTFFEMLGNFSFGDYFKEEIIPWSWEFLIGWLELPEDKLFVSVFEEDDEAYDIWHKKVGLPESKIFKLGEADNFWYMADTGPCGPDSEIFYDLGEKVGCGRPTCQPGCDCARYTEIWNLVFTQFDRQEDGELKPLPNRNVDTGMGLERTIAAIEGKVSVFEIDAFQPLISYIRKKAGQKGKRDTSGVIEFNPFFLMADHLRGSAFLIADDVYPGNEGRGYILRRIMRRAFLHAQRQGLKEGELIAGLHFIYESLGDAYPEIIEKSKLIEKILSREEEGFLSTLSRGEALLDKKIAKLEKTGNNVLAGETAFELYDTYGFPIDLTRDILREKGYKVDEDSFNAELEKQRLRSRADTATKLNSASGGPEVVISVEKPTEFVGFETTSAKAEIRRVTTLDKLAIVLDKTPFYAESGGQVGDEGIIKSDSFEFNVTKTIKDQRDVYYHIGEFTKGNPEVIQEETEIIAQVTESRRRGIMRSHTATHLMHSALRQVLGTHVKQAGSLVEDDRLRFDFSHYESVSFDNILKITKLVNKWILQGFDISTHIQRYSEAVKSGAMAIFGEKYGDEVRVVSMGDVSSELCGGTHLDNTSKIGSFVIIKEESIASGTRRIEALTGLKAIEYFLDGGKVLKELSSRFAVGYDLIESNVEKLFAERKSLEKELDKIRANMAKSQVAGLIEQAEKVGNVSLIIHTVDNLNNDALMSMAEGFKGKVDSYAALLIGKMPDKLGVVIAVSNDMMKKGLKAGDLIREICGVLGGGGGGRPNIAQGGGKDAAKIDDAINKFKSIINEKLN